MSSNLKCSDRKKSPNKANVNFTLFCSSSTTTITTANFSSTTTSLVSVVNEKNNEIEYEANDEEIISTEVDGSQEIVVKSSQDKKIQVLMPKSEDTQIESSNMAKITEKFYEEKVHVKYSTVLSKPLTPSTPTKINTNQQQESQQHSKVPTTSAAVSITNKNTASSTINTGTASGSITTTTSYNSNPNMSYGAIAAAAAAKIPNTTEHLSNNNNNNNINSSTFPTKVNCDEGRRIGHQGMSPIGRNFTNTLQSLSRPFSSNNNYNNYNNNNYYQQHHHHHNHRHHDKVSTSLTRGGNVIVDRRSGAMSGSGGGGQQKLFNISLQQSKNKKHFNVNVPPPMSSPITSTTMAVNASLDGAATSTSANNTMSRTVTGMENCAAGFQDQCSYNNNNNNNNNSKKSRRNKRAKDSQRKLKQNDNNYNHNNRSQSQSSTTPNNNVVKHNNNNNNNNVLSNNNTNNIRATTTIPSLETSSISIKKTFETTTDCTLINSSSSSNINNSIKNLPKSTSTSPTKQKSSPKKSFNINLTTDFSKPLSVITTTTTTTTAAASGAAVSSLNSRSNNDNDVLVSPSHSNKQADEFQTESVTLSDSDSETLTADSPEGYIRNDDIMEMYLKETPSLVLAREQKTDEANEEEQQQLNFLNSSSSVCDDDMDNSSSTIQHQKINDVMIPTSPLDLHFGDFTEDIEHNKNDLQIVDTVDNTTCKSKIETKITFELITTKSSFEVKHNKITSNTVVSSHNTDTTTTTTTIKKIPSSTFLRYEIDELKEMEKCRESRKPPMVDCKNRECITQLFVSRQQHTHQHKHLPSTHYQQMNFNESIDLLNKKRNLSGGSNGMGCNIMQNKKHHDLSLAASSSSIGMHHQQLQQQQQQHRIIRINLLLNKEIKLSESANAWQPSTFQNKITGRNSPQQQDDLAEVLKKVRGVLNKLTPDNFDVLLKSMSSIVINTQEKMQQVN